MLPSSTVSSQLSMTAVGEMAVADSTSPSPESGVVVGSGVLVAVGAGFVGVAVDAGAVLVLVAVGAGAVLVGVGAGFVAVAVEVGSAVGSSVGPAVGSTVIVAVGVGTNVGDVPPFVVAGSTFEVLVVLVPVVCTR